MTKNEMKKVADGVFKRYPNETKVYVTSDGQAFFDKVHAKNHSRPTKKRAVELEIETFLRKEEEVKTDEKK